MAAVLLVVSRPTKEAPVRRLFVAAALAALLAIVAVAPAGAVPPNEILIARNLQRAGILPPWATGRMAARAVRLLDPTPPRLELKSPQVERTVSGAGSGLTSYLERTSTTARGTTQPYTTKALVLLVEFGDEAWPAGSAAPTGPMTAGPLHGQIPAPAAGDNSTFWPGDSSPAHYQSELFGDSFPLYDATGVYRGSDDVTMRSWYLEQSHGSFTGSGDIRNWVKLDMPESWYGADSKPWEVTDDLNGPAWRVARDAVAKFAAENPDFPWADYDHENQFGVAGSDFNKPDGYVDHLILVHAGSDESAGGGAQQSDAIWAQSSSIWENLSGGPGDGPGYMVPGTGGQGPQGKGIWVLPYTINPEDGDPGVFCHEFGHDLGLPDEYDRVGTPGDGSGFWTIMADGSWLGREWGLGSAPGPMNVWDKAALGFITPKVVKRGTSATLKLQPAATGSPDSTGVIIPLPKRKHTVELSGKDGANEWYSGMAGDLDARLTTTDLVAVPAADPTLTFHTWYDIEEGYDFGFVLVSTDGGDSWTSVASDGNTVQTAGGKWALTGSDTGDWDKTISYDLSPWAGKKVLIRFRYVTDDTLAQRGWEITGVAVGGTPLDDSAFTSDGWLRLDGQTTVYSDDYYIAEYRTRDGSDASLADCYEFDRDRTAWVDWFSYDQGLHLIYRDTFWADNDVGAHPGEGGWMVVDARPNPDAVEYDGTTAYWRPRIQLRDAAFSPEHTPDQSIYFKDYDTGTNVGERAAPGKLAAPAFSDDWQYWFPETPLAGVKLPAGLGVSIRVKSVSASGMVITVDNVK
jgi:immune inhibitor A